MQEKSENYDVGVIVGRFQVPSLHAGHRALISYVCSKHDKVIVFLGLSEALGSRENPLDFAARKQMLLEAFPRLTVAYVKDRPSDEAWSRNLDNQITTLTTPHQSVVLYGARDSFIDHYLGRHTCKVLESDSYASGSAIRAEVSRREVRESPDFRAGVIWSTFNRYPTSFQTIDVAILDKGELLLGRKPDEEKWRFPGGFVDPRDPNLEAAVRREAQEETGLAITDPIYVGSARVDDWRYRRETDKIMTALFKAERLSGVLKAADDLAEVRWFPIDTDLLAQIEDVHVPLMASLALNLNRTEER